MERFGSKIMVAMTIKDKLLLVKKSDVSGITEQAAESSDTVSGMAPTAMAKSEESGEIVISGIAEGIGFILVVSESLLHRRTLWYSLEEINSIRAYDGSFFFGGTDLTAAVLF